MHSHFHNRLIESFIVFLLFACPHTTSAKKSYRLTDAHTHIVNFSQEGDDMTTFLSQMNKSGIEHTMLAGVPLVKKWSQHDPIESVYYLDSESPIYWYSATDAIVAHAYSKIPKNDQYRFHPFMSGINPTDMKAIKHLQRMWEMHPGLWQGIGEIICHKDDVTQTIYGERARPNLPALSAVYEFAANHKLPVNVHSDVTSAGKDDLIYLKEFENAVSKHPRTTFIWAHAGLNRRTTIDSKAYTKVLERLFRTHKNLYIDLSWVGFDLVIAPKGVLNQSWLKLVQQFPRRFMIGSDLAGNFSSLPKEIGRYDVLLDALSSKDARLVGRDNFLHLLPKKSVNAH